MDFPGSPGSSGYIQPPYTNLSPALADATSPQVLLNLAPSETQMQFRISDVCWSGSGKYRCPAYFEQANVRDLDRKNMFLEVFWMAGIY